MSVLSRHNVRNVPELFDTAEVRLDDRPAVPFVFLHDVILEALEPAADEVSFHSHSAAVIH